MHFSRNLVLHNALDVARTLGVQPSAILARVGLSEADAWKPGGLIPTVKLVEAVEIGAELTGVHDFGLHWGLAADFRTFGSLGVVASHHRQLSSALYEVGAYLTQMATGYSYTMKRDAHHVSLRFTIDVHSRLSTRHYSEGTVVMIARFARMISNEEWSPLRIKFTHDRIGSEQQYQDAFGCLVEFNQKFNGIVSTRDEIDRPIAIEQTPVHDMIQRVLEGSRQSEERSIPDKIGLLVPQLLPTGTATAAHVAALLNMSPRTLQRRLAELGVTFKDVVNAKREEILAEQVRLGFASGENLAAALGFSEPSAASRFIRNYLGKTAREMKSQARRRKTRRIGSGME
jgi:AraC-like DNA-binding protein